MATMIKGEVSMASVYSERLQCEWQAWVVVNDTTVRVLLPELNCTDQTGATAVAEALHPGVLRIETVAGTWMDTIYTRSAVGQPWRGVVIDKPLVDSEEPLAQPMPVRFIPKRTCEGAPLVYGRCPHEQCRAMWPMEACKLQQLAPPDLRGLVEEAIRTARTYERPMIARLHGEIRDLEAALAAQRPKDGGRR